jgi:hypothetical protein
MRAKFRGHLYLIIVGLLFLLLLSAALQLLQQRYFFPDSTSYFNAAVQLYHHFEPNDIRPMLIAAINGFPLVFGFPDNSISLWSIVINAVCWLSTILMLFEILKKFLPEKAAFVFSLGYLFCVGSAVLVFHLLSETIYAFFLFLVLFLFGKYAETREFKFLSLSLSVLILSLLVKPGATILVGVAFLYFIRVFYKNLKRKSVIFMLISVALVFCQMGMMKKKFGNFTISYIDSFTYYHYLGTRADCLKKNVAFAEAENERYAFFNKLPYEEQKKEASRDMKDQLLHNAPNLAKAYIINVADNAIHGSPAVSQSENIANSRVFETVQYILKVISKIQVILFSLLGFVLGVYWLLMARNDLFTMAVSVMALYVIGISGISSGQGDRFHLVIYPMVMILIAKFINDKTSILKK